MNATLGQDALELIESVAIGEFVTVGKSPSCKTWLPHDNGILVLGFDNSLVHLDLEGNQKKHHGEHQVWGTLNELTDHIKAHGENIVVYRDGAFFLVDQTFPSSSIMFRGQKNLVDWVPGSNGVFILKENGHLWFAPYDKSGAVKIAQTTVGCEAIVPHPEGLLLVSSDDVEAKMELHLLEAHSNEKPLYVGAIHGGRQVRVCGKYYVAEAGSGVVIRVNFENSDCAELFKVDRRSVRWETSGNLLVHQTCTNGRFEFEAMRLG